MEEEKRDKARREEESEIGREGLGKRERESG